MANKLNFKFLLGLETKGYDRGMKKVMTSLNALKMKFMSFTASVGAGLGLVEFARNLKNTAKSMDQAQTTLKNVSNSVSEYSQNQKFLMDLSKKYNQDLIVLTGNFSKFHASSDEANVPLRDQTKIFESLTRASAYFNLTADESNSVFLAITQMMSKGKVSAEELRRQLGERLPGAFGIMAKAAGMTTAELDKALATGQLMSAEILPKFADELNRVTKNIDVETIQGLSNRLKNAFIDLTKGFNAEGIYKSILKGAATVTEFFKKNVGTIKALIVGFLGNLGRKRIAAIAKAKMEYDAYYTHLNEQIEISKKKQELLQQKMNAFQISHAGYSFSEEKEIGKDGTEYNIKKVVEGEKAANKYRKDANKLVKEYNKQLIIQQSIQSKLTGQLSFGKKIWINIKGAFAAFARSTFWTAIIAGISAAINKLVQLVKKLNEANRAAKDFKKYMNDSAKDFNSQMSKPSSDVTILDSLKNVAKELLNEDLSKLDEKSRNRKLEEQRALLKSINKELGLEEDKYFDINTSVDDILNAIQAEIDLRREMASLDTAKSFKEDAQDRYHNIQNKIRDLYVEKHSYEAMIGNPNTDPFSKQYTKWMLNSTKKKIEEYGKELGELRKLMEKYDKDISDLSIGIVKKQIKPKKKEPEPIQVEYNKIQEDYWETLGIYKDKLNKGLIDKEEFKKKEESLWKDTLDSIYELTKKNNEVTDEAQKIYVGLDEFTRMLIKNIRSIDNGFDSISDFKEIMKKWEDESKKIKNKFNAGAFDSIEDFDSAMKNLVDEIYNSLAELGYLEGEMSVFTEMISNLHEAFEKKYGKKVSDKYASEINKVPKRDTTFDYEKSESEIYKERADIWKEQANILENKISRLMTEKKTPEIQAQLDEAIKELDIALSNAKNFSEFSELSKIKEDITGYKSSLTSNLTSGVNEISTVMDRIVDDIDKIANPDISGWEKLSVVLNGLLQIFDGVLNAMEMYKEMEEVINRMAGAEESLNQIKSNGNKEELMEDTALLASKQALQAQDAVNTATSLTGSASKVAAGQAEAMTNGTASAAKLPFPMNLAAIASIIAALSSVFAMIPKFANGGIVGGNSSSGDKVLARLNSGEMVLNKSQQNALLNSSGQVQFKIKGSDLVGVLNNYRKKITI